MNRVLLNNVDHAELRVAPRVGAEFGDRANQLPIYPAEFEQAQRDFPILFRRDGDSIDAIVLLGLDSDENLFLGEQGWTSRYVPAIQRRGPFSIALARDGDGGETGEPMVHVDLDDPRVGDDAGLPLFLTHGGDAPYLQHVSAALRTIYEGAQQARAINAQLAAAGLLRDVVLEIDLGDEGGYNVPGVLAVDEGALAALSDADVVRLHRAGLLRLDRGARAGEGVRRALRALAGFAKLKVKYSDFEVALDLEPEPGLADSGDLDLDLADLMVAVGEAARERDSALVLIVDELQYVAEDQLAALISALHRANQKRLPVTLVGAGLPQLLGQMGRAKSYAERLFEFVALGPLDAAAAADAIRLPIEREEETIEPEAVAAIVADTQGYPYFLQEWGKHSWDAADVSPITAADVAAARTAALAELDASFFRVRFDRLTPAEKRYLRAMATLGPGPHRSGDVAEALGVKVSSVAPTRNSLIAKGMLYSPAHGDTAFTVPLFDQFMRRVMPGEGG